MSVNPHDHSVIGYLAGRKVLTMPYRARQNMLILGEIGSGKSSVLRLLILQDIKAGRGFLLAENHSELSREVLSLIPPEQYDRIVYVSLSSIKKLDKTLRFNPLQIDDPHEAGMVSLTFTECLAKAFSDSWGARVETCARNGALAVIGTQSDTLGAMIRLLTDKEFSEGFVGQIQNRQARDFFTRVYWEQYPKEAGGVIFNKLNKMLTVPELDAMFNTRRSSITFEDILNRGMYVVLDFGGVTNDMTKFLGNVFLHLFYTAYLKRQRQPGGGFAPFNLYLDEVQMFSEPMIRELLNTVRKYGIKATIATQSTSAIEREFAAELPTLCRAIACFRCDATTAASLKSILPIKPERQTQLPFHHFSFWSGGTNPVKAVAKTRHMEIPDRSEEASRHSVMRLGKFVSLDKYYTQSGGGADVQLTPLEFGILNLLRTESRDMTKKEITDAMLRRYATDARHVSSALHDTLIATNGYVSQHDTVSDDGDEKFESRYTITKSAMHNLFSRSAAGRRAGGDLHLSAIFAIMEINVNNGRYCVPDLGRGAAKQADLVIYSPKPVRDRDGRKDVLFNPSEWSDDITAVEVETGPGKHWEQVYVNWQKSSALGHSVWFVVFDAATAERMHDTMKQNGVSRDKYRLTVMDRTHLTDTKSENIRSMSACEARIMEVLSGAGGTATQRFVCDSVWQFDEADVIASLQGLEGRLERSGITGRGGDADGRRVQDPSLYVVWSLPGVRPLLPDKSGDLGPEDMDVLYRGRGSVSPPADAGGGDADGGGQNDDDPVPLHTAARDGAVASGRDTDRVDTYNKAGWYEHLKAGRRPADAGDTADDGGGVANEGSGQQPAAEAATPSGSHIPHGTPDTAEESAGPVTFADATTDAADVDADGDNDGNDATTAADAAQERIPALPAPDCEDGPHDAEAAAAAVAKEDDGDGDRPQADAERLHCQRLLQMWESNRNDPSKRDEVDYIAGQIADMGYAIRMRKGGRAHLYRMGKKREDSQSRV